MKYRTLCWMIFGVFCVPLSATAHHSMSIYDTDQQVTIDGTLTRVQWTNPHVYFYVEETLDNGDSFTWEIEGLGPASYRRIGWARDTVQVGEPMTIVGNPTRNIDRRGIYPISIHRNQDQLFNSMEFMNVALAATDASGSNTSGLSGKWMTQLKFELIVQFTEGVDLTNLTEDGARAFAEFEELTMNPAANCELIAAPLLMIMPDMKQFAVGDNTVRIQGDYDGAERVIHLDRNSHAGAPVSWQGHSIGRWDGNTLEIDTANFAENTMGNGWGIPSSSEKRMKETITLNEDGSSFNYSFEVTDPVYMSAPFAGATDYKSSPNLEFSVDECNLESARTYIGN
ncbi:MAG: hypothetical protein GKR91_06730 [Pseudomonadales bacterium]|nr:hypothetical protein [Pseudomonadales bacterium]